MNHYCCNMTIIDGERYTYGSFGSNWHHNEYLSSYSVARLREQEKYAIKDMYPVQLRARRLHG